MADVVGYSRLIGLDESGTLAVFKRHVRESIRPAIFRCHGRLVKTLGDGLLVEFDSPVNAVECAISIQRGAGKLNRSLQPDRKMQFRIGINLGDVVIDKSDIFGEGVNIAARLQALAEPGGIVVSGSVVQQVKGKVPLTFEDLGERIVKNIKDPIRVFRVSSHQQSTEAATRPLKEDAVTPSVAILPFVNMSRDPQQQYFSDGMTEDIITELSRFRTISVIARNSSFAYRDKCADARQIGRELGVQFIVEGSLRKL